MLAADRSLLEVNLRQQAIKLREKELNLYSENFSAMATQAAVLAGFTTTCIIEINIPPEANETMKALLHVFGIISICANITCVSLSTITIIWGSGKALRGTDGSMDEAVEGINDERQLIFSSFAIGLMGNLLTVLCACFTIMDFTVAVICAVTLLYTMWLIYTNAMRITNKFMLMEAVRLDDLTRYNVMGMPRTSSGTEIRMSNGTSDSSSLLGRGRRAAGEIV
mmetsp:Transcript_24630/g.41067  ORF Transcript_24630/g.41067 Transcript_24630/m.41067 type:complete len:224 (-) Transcript_24630:173-844(-)